MTTKDNSDGFKKELLEEYKEALESIERPVRNQDFFNQLNERGKTKRGDNLEKQIDKAINKLKALKKYQDSNEEKQKEMIEQKEEETREQFENASLSQMDILQILKHECPLFRYVTLEDTETTKQKELYIFDWDKGIYTKDITFFYKVISVLNSSTTEKIDKAIYYDLMKTASYKYKRKAERSGRYIAFKNGLWDGVACKLSEHFNPDIILLSCVPFEYNANAGEPVRNGVSNTGEPIEWHGRDIIDLFKNGDKKREILFYEVVRAIMSAKRNAFLFAWNEKGNGGKSTIGRMFSIIAGEKQTKLLNTNDFGQRFAFDGIEICSLIFGDDGALDKHSAKAIAMLKTLVTSNQIPTEGKGKDVKNSYFDGIIYQCSNALFTTDDITGGIIRRCIFLPFAEIPQSRTCAQVSEWIIKETLEHCPNAPERYTEPTNNEQYKQEFKENNDPYISFVDEYIKPIAGDCERIPLVFIYRHLFPIFCEEYPHLEKKSIQAVNKGIKDKMELLGYEYKKDARINEQQFHPIFKDINGNQKNYYSIISKENNGRNKFRGVYIRG